MSMSSSSQFLLSKLSLPLPQEWTILSSKTPTSPMCPSWVLPERQSQQLVFFQLPTIPPLASINKSTTSGWRIHPAVRRQLVTSNKVTSLTVISPDTSVATDGNRHIATQSCIRTRSLHLEHKQLPMRLRHPSHHHLRNLRHYQPLHNPLLNHHPRLLLPLRSCREASISHFQQLAC